MKIQNQQLKQFLSANQLLADAIDSKQLLNNFIDEMNKGLQKQDSSLAMLSSHIGIDSNISANKPVIVLDAGGTNLRVCTVYFNTDGTPVMDNFATYTMPGIEKALSRDEFYETICGYLEPVIELSDTISFCFSYPTEIAANKDGKLLYWTKEVEVPEVVGEYIGEGLVNALVAKGHKKKNILLLNDTVATLLAGKAFGEQRGCEGYVGLILGTGTNTAYVEANANIADFDSSYGSQIINIESGNFNKLPVGEIDKLLDNTTANPGQYLFEKMISGRYLGATASIALNEAVKAGLLSSDTADLLDTKGELMSAALSKLLENPNVFNRDVFGGKIADEDLSTIYLIVESLVERAAKFTSINMAATALKMNVGHDPLHPVCINADGSTYFKLHGFRAKCEAYLREILDEQGVHFIVTNTDNAPVIGTAIAGVISH